MTITINGTDGITTPEVTLDNTSADGGQVVLKSSGYSNWNLDNYSGRLRAYYGSTEYFTVNSSGNVGIGTSSIASGGAGTVNFNVNTPSANSVYFKLSNASTGNTASDGFDLLVDTSGNGYIYNRENAATIFGTSNTERARITSNGRTLIAKTSETGNSNLQVSTTPGGNSGITISATTTGTNYAMLFYTSDGVDHGYISYTTSGTSYNTTSDYRLKENIAPMTGALSVVSQLKPCTYTWKATGEEGQGFIAHELAEVVPDCVTGEKDAVETYTDENGVEQARPRYQGIDTSFLVATLTAAIQELKAIVDAQRVELDAAKADIATLTLALKGQA